MLTIDFRYDIELDWVEPLAQRLGGYVEGNFIKTPEGIQSGCQYVTSINSGISAMLIDVTYNKDIWYKQRNLNNDLIGIQYYFNSQDVKIRLNDEFSKVEKRSSNISILDSVLDADFIMSKNTKQYLICIYITKALLKEHLVKIKKYESIIETIFNPKKNTFIRFDRMSHKSEMLINDLRKVEYENLNFEMTFKSTVYALLGDYLDSLSNREIIVGKVRNDEIIKILESQTYLLKEIESVFPGIDILADKAGMSSTKYKQKFKKIIGLSPKVYFLNNKIELAKELLETSNYTIGEISEKLHYTNASYFANQFKEYFKILPKEFISQLY
ncbi:helix-turn-helix domain-containing protein [Flavobacterium sp. '19STA2R22 D10 B1']|uniref:helix-turn-helix domain-containing protein n=1 Tax=Flavobacterium aerium TaxID=3037261 RepID=UPI00278BCC96|nr:helix-turn-helix transcriptional regulator [Flavobacterium sp. '19STA2R22 D10 B1']